MNHDLVSLLRCPRCRDSLSISGTDTAGSCTQLECAACRASYPVVDGVPRLHVQEYVASFGRQWNRYDVVRDDEDEAVFRVKTGVDPRDLVGKLVLDAGCGGGRYALLAARQGARIVGLDLSDAVNRAGKLCAPYPEALVVQADLLDPPLVEDAFDLVFSIGVLHHSPDPRRAFDAIARRVKPGGRLAVWLYRRNSLPQEWLNSALRAVTTRLPARVLEPACVALGVLGSIPILKKSLNKVINFSNHPDWTLRVCDNFDWYAPRHQSHHTERELLDWFEGAGFADLRVLPPAHSGKLYDWAFGRNLIIGSGVNVTGTRRS